MKMLRQIISPRTGRRGAVSIMVVFSMIVLLGIASLAVDTGYMFMAKNELQNIADAAALASTRQLGVIYEGIL